MGKQKKSTKLFKKNHLKDAIDQRKKRQLVQAKSTSKNTKKPFSGKKNSKSISNTVEDEDESLERFQEESGTIPQPKFVLRYDISPLLIIHYQLCLIQYYNNIILHLYYLYYRPLEEMSADEFMAQGFQNMLDDSAESDINDEDDEEAVEDTHKDEQSGEDAEEYADNDKLDEVDSDSASDGDEELDAMRVGNTTLAGVVDKHQAQLERLKKDQPEFYKFLLENDKVIKCFYLFLYP